MTPIVVDASVASGWLLDDERDQLSRSALRSVEEDGAIVPQHWRFEVANSLLFAERRGRLLPGRARLRLRSLNDLAIDLDDSSDVETALALAFEHNLTMYDAIYLELALRTGFPLATLDDDLVQVAPHSGVELFGA